MRVNKNGLSWETQAVRRDDSSIAPGSFELDPILDHLTTDSQPPRAGALDVREMCLAAAARPRTLKRRRSLKGNQGSTGLLPPRPDHSGGSVARVHPLL
jgi:hypothetical protein